jgi:hypothetical protein
VYCRTWARALSVSLASALISACSSATIPDAGANDGGVRADAAADALPGPELPPGADALPTPDAQADAAVDAGPQPDAGVDRCGPVPREGGVARLSTALGSWLQRCNPELTGDEALVLARGVSAAVAPAFDAPSLTYDATSAGACGCAIEAASCDALALFRAIPSCDATLTNTATTPTCLNDFECASRQYCEGAIGTAAGGPICAGTCRPIHALGEACAEGPGRCEPGLSCDYDQARPVCVTSPAVGMPCGTLTCAGGTSDVFLLPHTECEMGKGGSVCAERGRTGADCFSVRCNALYECLPNNKCLLRAGAGEPCATPYDELTPSPFERQELIASASESCRVGVPRGVGYWCTQTGTTTGVATCLPLPTVGQPCGIGRNLATACAPGAYCPGIDDLYYTDTATTCAPARRAGEACVPNNIRGNDPCEPGYSCADVGAGPVCTALCSGAR